MTSQEVYDVLYEALLLYLDDISAITNVDLLQDAEKTDGEGFLLEFKDGSSFRLLMTIID